MSVSKQALLYSQELFHGRLTVEAKGHVSLACARHKHTQQDPPWMKPGPKTMRPNASVRLASRRRPKMAASGLPCSTMDSDDVSDVLVGKSWFAGT